MSPITPQSPSTPSTNSEPNAEPSNRSGWKRTALIAAVAATVVTAGLTALLVSIVERKSEAKQPYFKVVELTDQTDDPAEWGKNFPYQYDTYKRTVDQTRTRYGGSEALPQAPSQADPRAVVTRSKIDEDPRLKKMWAGYAFSKDFREERGHAYMLLDQRTTKRVTEAHQPGTCLNCHASTYNLMKDLGGGDLTAGFHKMNAMTYEAASALAKHPVSCIDCHDPTTMVLRVTKPAFIEGIKVYKASQGVADYDVNTMATRQEMRAFVCGQCHVEYYFKGKEKTLTFPWFKGLKADEILAYYDEVGFKDWTHADTGAPALKAQHPEFELWNQGTHARAGVTCVDCHMPYERVGGLKLTNHHVRSPLLNINAACSSCHTTSEEELRTRVETIQARHFELRDHAMDALMDLIDDIQVAKTDGLTGAALDAVLVEQRRASFLLDFAEAENSVGFHAPQEGSRVLGLSIDHARQGARILLQARLGKPIPTAPAPPAEPAPTDAAPVPPPTDVPPTPAPAPTDAAAPAPPTAIAPTPAPSTP